MSSFFGFANDKKNKYTIGVTIREPQKPYFYAAKSASPVFKQIVRSLVKLNYLKPQKIANKSKNISKSR